jgi:hypothetical protein
MHLVCTATTYICEGTYGGQHDNIGNNHLTCGLGGTSRAVCDASSAACDSIDGSSIDGQGSRRACGVQSTAVMEVLRSMLMGGGQGRKECHR